MADVNKGIACRVCKHNENGLCTMNQTVAADSKDDCWLFQNRKAHSGVADAAPVEAYPSLR